MAKSRRFRRCTVTAGCTTSWPTESASSLNSPTNHRYISGDTVFTNDVERALTKCKPDICVVEFAIVLTAAQTTNFFRKNIRFGIWLDRVLGSVLIGLGVRLALTNNPK